MRSRKVDADLLRRMLMRGKAVVARPREPLVGFLRDRIAPLSSSPRLILTGLIDGGSEHESMCRFTVEGDEQKSCFVAPLSHLSFGRDGQFSNRLSRRAGAKLRKESMPAQGNQRHGPRV